MSIEVCTQVYKTKDYKMFKTLAGNRLINSSNYNKLLSSMRKKQLNIPIVVNERYEVIDGQHRLKAWEELGLYVYFIVVPGYQLEDVIRANTAGKQWDTQDYLQQFVLCNMQDYIMFKEIKDKYHLNINDILKLLALFGNKKMNQVQQQFREGNLDISRLYFLEEFLSDLQIFKEFKYYRMSSFITAFAKLYRLEAYDHAHMSKKANVHLCNLSKQNSVDEYLSLLCNKLYSFGITKEPIFYSVESKKFHN